MRGQERSCRKSTYEHTFPTAFPEEKTRRGQAARASFFPWNPRQIGVCRDHHLPPAALFLVPARNRGKNRAKGFPLCNSPTPKINSPRLSARMLVLCADSGLPARPSPLSAYSPFRSHARGCQRRRDGENSLSVLPETGRKPAHSRSRSQAATSCSHSSARRRRKSRHVGGIPKGGALRRVFCPAFSARAEKGWPSETFRQTPICKYSRFSCV